MFFKGVNFTNKVKNKFSEIFIKCCCAGHNSTTLELLQPIKQLDKDCSFSLKNKKLNKLVMYILHCCEKLKNFIERKSQDDLSSHMKLCFISQSIPAPKIHNFGHLRTLMVYINSISMMKKLDCGISNSSIVGHILFEKMINSGHYCSDNVMNFISQLTEADNNNWLQDITRVHTANRSVILLNDVFREWTISMGLWLPQSPDLSPLNHFLWGAVKKKNYHSRTCIHE